MTYARRDRFGSRRVDLKEAVIAFLANENREVLDVGTFGTEPVDYPDYAEAVGAGPARSPRRARHHCVRQRRRRVDGREQNSGRAGGLCHDTYSAHQGVEHDDMNVLVLGGRVVGVELARELVGAFLHARFTGDARHRRRLAKLTALENPLRALQVFGQSVWLDYVRRSLITSGELRRLVIEDGLRGVTSNPAIFEKAVSGSSDYRDLLGAPDTRELNPTALYERLAIRDIQDAADVLRHVYEETSRRDGYVSLEVSPFLAHDTASTLDEARRLWRTVGRENLMIKVPATPAGILAIRQLIGDGINVNATLLFAHDAYEQVVEAYLSGLEQLAARDGDLTRVASVASFFVSRIDTAIDALISERLLTTRDPVEQHALRSLSGKAAIANARLAYRALPGTLRRSTVAGAGRPRRQDAAALVGQYRHEEPELSRRRLRGRTDRP